MSPFQRKFVLDMSENSTASLNAITESDQTMAPTTGYFFNLFAMQTLQHYKLTIAVSMDASQSVPIAQFDEDAGCVRSSCLLCSNGLAGDVALGLFNGRHQAEGEG